jgi:hypothetical protein
VVQRARPRLALQQRAQRRLLQQLLHRGFARCGAVKCIPPENRGLAAFATPAATSGAARQHVAPGAKNVAPGAAAAAAAPGAAPHSVACSPAPSRQHRARPSPPPATTRSCAHLPRRNRRMTVRRRAPHSRAAPGPPGLRRIAHIRQWGGPLARRSGPTRSRPSPAVGPRSSWPVRPATAARNSSRSRALHVTLLLPGQRARNDATGPHQRDAPSQRQSGVQSYPGPAPADAGQPAASSSWPGGRRPANRPAT